MPLPLNAALLGQTVCLSKIFPLLVTLCLTFSLLRASSLFADRISTTLPSHTLTMTSPLTEWQLVITNSQHYTNALPWTQCSVCWTNITICYNQRLLLSHIASLLSMVQHSHPLCINCSILSNMRNKWEELTKTQSTFNSLGTELFLNVSVSYHKA